MTELAAAAPITREPWGTTPQTALRWAYRQRERSNMPEGVLTTFMQSRRNRSIDQPLTRLEIRAQAALICRAVETLPEPVHRCILTAYYLPAPTVENMAGGGREVVDRYARERKPAVIGVAHWLLKACPTSTAPRRDGYTEAVLQYCLGVRNGNRLAELLACRRERLEERRSTLYKTLDEKLDEALAAVGRKLRADGLLPE